MESDGKMDYEKMFVYLISIIFMVNVFINFFALAMPESTIGIIPSNMSFNNYTQGDMANDLNAITQNENPLATSDSAQGDTWNIFNMFGSWNIFVKLFTNVFFGYYRLSIYFADSLEISIIGPIHILFGGIGLLFSIIMIIGFVYLIRSVIFRV